MDPVVIVIIVVVVLLIIAALILVPRMRSRAKERRQVQARDHREEAQRLAAQAESAQAAADEKAATARRERAEAELRAADAQREAQASMAEAERQRADAERLEQKAAKLDPNAGDHGDPAMDDRARMSSTDRPDDRLGDRPYAGPGSEADHPAGRDTNQERDRSWPADSPVRDDPRSAEPGDEPGPTR